LDVPLNGALRNELAVSPANTSRVYLLAGDVDGPGVFDGLYRSTDSGVSYTQRANSPNILGREDDGSDSIHQIRFDHALTVSSSNSNTVFSGGIAGWRSTDGGATFDYSHDALHADIHELAVNPLNGTMYACTDGGLFSSTNDGQDWTELFDGYRASMMYHMVGNYTDTDHFLGGLQDNGIKRRRDNTGEWKKVVTGDGFDVAYELNSTAKFYGTLNQKMIRFTLSGLGQNVITPNANSNGNYEWFGTIATHVNDEDIIFAGYSNVFKSENKGSSWTDMGASGSWAMATCPSNENRIYAAGASSYANGTGGLFRSDNLGTSWTNIHTSPGFPAVASIAKITDVDVNPNSSATVYATIGGFNAGIKVFRSTDAGASWTNWSGSLPDIPIICVKIALNGDVYIGTDLGVFYRKTSMSDWMPFNNELPKVPVTDLHIDEVNGKIYASTFGRGVWKASVATGCPENLNLIASLKGDHLYQVNNQLISTADIIGGVGTNVHFKANNRVFLLPGFRAYRYTVFSAYIEACGSGGIPGIDSDEQEEFIKH
jgi:hypothetical protein